MIMSLPGFCRVSAGVIETRQNSGSCVMADVIGFSGKLLELSVKCLVLWQM
jgi:hypothetical protein